MEYRQDARICQGDNKTLQVMTSNPASIETAGVTARYCIATSPLGDKVVTKIDLPVEVVTPNLLISIALTTDDTNDLFPGDYYHEVTVTLGNGANITVMSGTLRVDPSANSFVVPMRLAAA